MNTSEKANFITASRNAISEIVKGTKTLQMLSENAIAAGGIAGTFTNDDFTGTDAGIAAATLINFFFDKFACPGICLIYRQRRRQQDQYLRPGENRPDVEKIWQPLTNLY